MTEDRDNVKNRVGQRFGDEQKEKNGENEQKGQKSQNAKNEKTGQKVENVKQAWTATSVYLPDDLHGRVGRTYKRLDFELDEDLDAFKKTRHYYPLLVAAGLEALEGMDDEEIVALLEDIGQD